MATIIEAQSKSKRNPGKISYRAQVRVRTTSGQQKRLSATFARRKAAEQWAKRKEDESERTGVSLKSNDTPTTMGDLLECYLRDMNGKLNQSKLGCLRFIKDLPFGDVECEALSAKHITDLGRAIAKRTTTKCGQIVSISPATVMTYISNLSSVLNMAESTYGAVIDITALPRAKKSLKNLELIDSSAKRDRRPSLAELEKLLTHFSDPKTASAWAPMPKIILFQIFSTRRASETTRLRWGDYRPSEKRILVRNMKHPTKKRGNDVWVTLPDRAIDIIETMPRTSEFIFPYNAGSIGTAFERACDKLGIEDLHYHDLRHEGVSHLFECDRLAPEVMQVSGHRTMQLLERYNQFEKRGDKYAQWPWIDRVTQPESEEETRTFNKTRSVAIRRSAQRQARKARDEARKRPPKRL